MIGPGTGIAPFLGFLDERRAKGARGPNWLFFGEQRRATDHYYEHELAAFQHDGVLQRLDVAFSRDQRAKVYVQDRMLEHGARLWAWLEEGAHVYVCGDMSAWRRTSTAPCTTSSPATAGWRPTRPPTTCSASSPHSATRATSTDRVANSGASSVHRMCLVSKNSAKPRTPPSRPRPLCLKPPHG